MFIKPTITKEILQRIAADIFGNDTNVQRIGIVGSFARDDFSYDSDIDWVIDCNQNINIANEIAQVSYILEQQFIRSSDFIRYSDILEGLKRDDYKREGYEQMLKDLTWIYERGSENEFHKQRRTNFA